MKMDPQSPIFTETGRHMVVDTQLYHKFVRIFWGLVLVGVAQVSMLGCVIIRHRQVIREYGLLKHLGPYHGPTHTYFRIPESAEP